MKLKDMEKNLIFNEEDKTIKQVRPFNPPSYNGWWRDKVREKFPDYTLLK